MCALKQQPSLLLKSSRRVRQAGKQELEASATEQFSSQSSYQELNRTRVTVSELPYKSGEHSGSLDSVPPRKFLYVGKTLTFVFSW